MSITACHLSLVSYYNHYYLLLLWPQEMVHIIYSFLGPRKEKKKKHKKTGVTTMNTQKDSPRDYRPQGLCVVTALLESHLLRPLRSHPGPEEVLGTYLVLG